MAETETVSYTARSMQISIDWFDSISDDFVPDQITLNPNGVP